MTALHPTIRTITGDPHTAEGRANRLRFVGASEVPAVVGASPYESAYTVYARKLGMEAERPESYPMARGNALEPLILRFGGVDGITTGLPTILHPVHDCCGANLDGAILDDDGRILTVVECKSWQLEDAEGVELVEHSPDDLPVGKHRSALIQIHYQIAVTGARGGILLADCGGRIVRAHVKRSQIWCDYLIAEVVGFWREYVEARTPPPVTALDLPALGALPRREKASVTSDDPQLADALRRHVLLGERIRELDTERDELSARIRLALGDAEVLHCEGLRATRARNNRLTVKG